MTIAIKITLLAGFYASDDCSCEVDENMKLDDLHVAILNIIKFDNDHIYQFFTSRR